MRSYRVYIIGRDGRLQFGAAFEASDDKAAAARAVEVAQAGRTAELWAGGRLVGKVSTKGVFVPGEG